ncbi:MAG: hypothetical protein ABI334_09430 [Candidatus Dormiibacterota bacterium]
MRIAAAFVLGAAVSLAGVLVGAWWAPFTVGLAIGFVIPRARVAVPAGAVSGLLAWTLPLLAAHARYDLGPAARSLAAIMGFTHEPAIPIVLTCLVGLLLGTTGAWLGSAVSSLSPSGRGLARGA